MERDLKLFKELLMRLPLWAVEGVMERVYPLKHTQIEKDASQAIQKLTRNPNIVIENISWYDSEYVEAFSVVIDTCHIALDVKRCPNRYKKFAMFMGNSYLSAIFKDDGQINDWQHPEVFIPYFPLVEVLTGIQIDASFKVTRSGMHKKVIDIIEEAGNGLTFYWKQSAYTLLAIYTFHKDSVVAKLPRDVLKMIIKFILN